ncbi:hypothetical protein AcV7_005598 [Taiwanofungus camphoratus]|nr:hypothetical protein AcV7_005598 [Antrodia cinnamomea]
MPGKTLIPGYRQVETFGPDEDYEQRDGQVEEEIAYVTLDLGLVEPTLVPSSSSYRLIGLDTPTPFLQLSGTVFKGEHQSLLGTELLFTEAQDDNHDRSKKSLVHVGTTEQRIRFKEVELREKTADSSPDAQKARKTAKSSKKIPGTVDEVVGSLGAEPGPSRGGRGSRRGRGGGTGNAKSKGKGKEQAGEELVEGDDNVPGDYVEQAKPRKGKSKWKGKERAIEPPEEPGGNVPSNTAGGGGPVPMDVDDSIGK